MNVQLAPLANPGLPRVQGEWATGEPGSALQSWTGRKAGASQRGQGLDADVCSGAISRNWQTDHGKSNCLCLESGTQGRGDENTYGACGNYNKITKSSSTSSVCLCVYVSVLRTALFFSKLSAQKHTLALLTLA